MRTTAKTVTVVLLALGLGACGNTATPSSSPSLTPSMSPSVSLSPTPTPPITTTTLALTFTDCEGCTVEIGRAVDRMGSPESLGVGKVVNGQISFEIPVAKTRGAAIMINRNPDGSDGGYARPDVVIQYVGAKPGDVFTAKDVAAFTSASYCWAGTDQASINMTIDRFTYTWATPGTGETHLGSSYWTTPQQSALLNHANVHGTYKSGMGDQDWPYCELPTP